MLRTTDLSVGVVRLWFTVIGRLEVGVDRTLGLFGCVV